MRRSIIVEWALARTAAPVTPVAETPPDPLPEPVPPAPEPDPGPEPVPPTLLRVPELAQTSKCPALLADVIGERAHRHQALHVEPLHFLQTWTVPAQSVTPESYASQAPQDESSISGVSALA